MSAAKRTIPDYKTDLIALVDISKVLDKQALGFETKRRVLNFTVKRELGEEFAVVKIERRPGS